MATDVAFALGVVALLGARVPAPIKVLLLTLAIVDDIGAIVVIALFYTSDLEPIFLVFAAGLAVVVVVILRPRRHLSADLPRPRPVAVVDGLRVRRARHDRRRRHGLADSCRAAADRPRGRRGRRRAGEPRRAARFRRPHGGLRDPRVGLGVRPADRRTASVDELRHRAAVRCRQRRRGDPRRRAEGPLGGVRRGAPRTRRRQARRHHGVLLADRPSRPRPAPCRNALGSHHSVSPPWPGSVSPSRCSSPGWPSTTSACRTTPSWGH